MQDVGGFSVAVPGEVTALDHLPQPRLLGSQPGQQLVQRKDLLDLRLDRDFALLQRHLLYIAAALLAPSPPSVIDDHLTHRAGGDREEVIAVVPRRSGLIDELQVRLVDEASRIEGTGGSPATELPARNPAQLGVHQTHQLIECAGSAFAVRDQNRRDAFNARHVVPRLADDDRPALTRDAPSIRSQDPEGRNLGTPVSRRRCREFAVSCVYVK